MDADKVDHWLSVGAKPTEIVANLIREARKQTELKAE
jgi:ribosomal protein S16